MVVLTKQEEGIIGIVRLNEANPIKAVRKSFRIFGFEVEYERRRKDNLWGRFGGGWDWALGFELGGSTLLINLLVSIITIHKIKGHQ